MNVAAPATPHWTVSARPDGEVLAVWCGGDELQLGVMATPGSFTPAEYEGWLNDLIGVARETARAGSDPQPIPSLLHQALSGLLFSHAELWERAGGSHCSIALVAAGEEIGVGWVGGIEVEVAVDGEPIEVPWVIVRDAEGREARAARFDARQWLRVGMIWTPNAESSEGVMIDADWPGAATLTGALETPAETLASLGSSGSGTAEPFEFVPLEAQTEYSEVEIATATQVPGDRAEGPSFDLRAATPPRRPGPLARFWNWFTGRSRPRPVMVASENDPPWVDVATATEGSEESYASFDSDRRALDPSAADPAALRIRAPEDEDESEVLEPAPLEEPEAIDARLETEAFDAALEPEPLEATLEYEELPAAPELEYLEGPDASAADEIVPIGDQSSPARPSLASPMGYGAPEDELADVRFLNDPQPPRSVAPARKSRARAFAPGDRMEAAPEVDSGKPLRPRWPSATEMTAPPRWWTRRWAWAMAIAILFGGGWLLGGMQNDRDTTPGAPHPFTRALRAIGLGGATFDCAITSRPPGAWIAVDGQDYARRTPANLELKPGTHEISLSFTDLGAAAFQVQGVRGGHVTLDQPLWGSLTIEQVDPGVPVTVAVDGRALGYVPAQLDSLSPGAHEVRFSGPGMTPWAQTVGVRVREAARVVARPMTAPGTGVLVVSATQNDEMGRAPLNGGEVWIDGQLKGHTPFTLELPRGPHSVRVVSHGESAPVQVIDLPGGNQRFASFELGLGSGGPQLVPVQIADRVTADHPALVSAALDGINISDIHEMWLHVRGADGPWRRYALDVMKTPSGAVGVTVFPLGVFDPQGHTQYYLSALTSTGDEYFTEIVSSELAAPKH